VSSFLIADHAFSEPNCSLVDREPPAWKRLVTYALEAQERVSLITDIFSEQDEPEAVEHLRGEDAQAFVDVIDKVRSHISTPKKRARRSRLKPPRPVE